MWTVCPTTSLVTSALNFLVEWYAGMIVFLEVLILVFAAFDIFAAIRCGLGPVGVLLLRR